MYDEIIEQVSATIDKREIIDSVASASKNGSDPNSKSNV
jgi:hypothetical protein